MNRRAVLAGGMAAAALGSIEAAAQAPPRRRIDVRDFGAKGDGTADDTAAIQAAINAALEARIPAVHLPAGRYRTTDTIHLGYGETFTTLALLGDGAPSFAGSTAGTLLLPERTDRPALNIQGARMSLVRDVAILGKNHGFIARKIADLKGVNDPDPNGWLDPALRGGLRRNAPYAAITVDAYSAPPQVDGYPAPPTLPWARERPVPPARAFSSDVTIERCWVGGFAVGVAVHPAGSDGNGDFVRLSAIIFHNCVYCVAVAQTQSRNFAIRDCNYARVHTFLTNRHFGRGKGTLGGPIDNVSGGYAYQFMDVFSAGIGPLTVSALFVESQVRLGVWSNNSAFNEPLTFHSCKLNLYEELTGGSPAALLECGQNGSVRFVGCTFHAARRIFHPVRGASYVELDSCMLAHVIEHSGEHFYRDVPASFARAINYTCGGVFLHKSALRGECALAGRNTGLDMHAPGRRAEVRPRGSMLVAVPGERTVVHHYAREFVDRFGRTWTIRHRPEPAAWDKQGAQVRRLSYVSPDRLAIELDLRLVEANPLGISAGDLLYDGDTATILVVTEIAVTLAACHLVALQLNNLAERDGVVRASEDVTRRTGALWLYSTSAMLGDRVFHGNFTAGSRTVAGLHPGNGSAAGLARCLVTGDVLHWVGTGPPLQGSDRPEPYPIGTRIASVDEARGTVELDKPATATARHLVSTVALS